MDLALKDLDKEFMVSVNKSVEGVKSPASITNMYVALLHAHYKISGHSGWCVFSSRLGPRTTKFYVFLFLLCFHFFFMFSVCFMF
jgi:hypothetical protein